MKPVSIVRRKRRKPPKRMKDGELSVSYGYLRDESSEAIYYTNGPGCHSADARVMAHAFEGVEIHDGKSLAKVLEARGYDMTTLRFTIQKKPVAGQKP